MAYSIKEQLRNPVVQLREDLDEAERTVSQLTPANVESFLQLLDRIEQQFTALEASGIDLRGERGRQASLHNRLERQPNVLVSAAARAGGLQKLREQNPPAENFWWHLDAAVTAARRRQIRRFAIVLGALVLFLGGLYFVVETFFPPSPDVLLLNDATNQLNDLALEGRWEEALHVIEETKAQLGQPDAELLIWEGVVAEQLGLVERSEAVLAEARELVGPESETLYWVNLGNIRLLVQDYAGAEAAAETALTLNPQEAQAFFLLAGIAESRGEIAQAVDYYERTFEYAADSNPQLAVISRVRLGTLLQSGGGVDIPGGTPTATP
jgi:tetratricopeptide (TPR) repeat protein